MIPTTGFVPAAVVLCVCLFAGLSYTLTQSTRSGAGDTASETNLISSAQLTQYPAGIRTSVVRMIIGGIKVEDLLFNAPDDFDAIADKTDRTVFHPQGGNATFQRAPADVVSGLDGTWFFNAHLQIQNIGHTSTTDSSGNDVIAFLPGLTDTVCKRINEEIGLGEIPTTTQWPSTAYRQTMDHRYTFPARPGSILDGPFTGHPFGCFHDGGSGQNVYYHVLVER
ncbi:MAG: hypothetical protein KKA05_03575 [Alphaproteobacteria bacterium]|nr:hypothetical protein [Alphaproteobacteria bacterium]